MVQLGRMPIPPADIRVDESRGEIIIYGVRYSLEVFKEFAFGTLGRPIKVVERRDGTITVECSGESDDKMFSGCSSCLWNLLLGGDVAERGRARFQSLGLVVEG